MKRFFTEHEKTLWLLLLFACMFFLGRGIGAIVYGLHMQQEMSPRETVGSALENTQEVLSAENWGLGFGTEGTQPAGTASAEELKEYNAYYVGDAEEKKIYLTFDCGYENGNSSAILDALKRHNAPATFFVVGHFLESAPVPVSGLKGNSEYKAQENKVGDLAYVIYTSGTTGMPKGVMITHHNAVNTILDINARYQITEQDTAFGISNLHFDLSVYDVFGVLGAGGKLVLPDPEYGKDPAHWIHWLNHENITVWNSVPAFVEMLAEYEEYQRQVTSQSLRLIMMSGDWVPVSLPGRIRNLFQNVEIVALGGATEGSIWSNHFEIPEVVPEDWKSIPYGKPLANQKYYILDQNMEDCPDWVPGTLYIAGDGVAQGYLNDKEKTEEKFVVLDRNGERLYCTGDMGRYWNDGNIEFLGRLDNQVKINGYRVELGEIEAAVSDIFPENRSVVIPIKRNNGIVIIGIVEGKLYYDEKIIKKKLESTIPKYEIPKRIFNINEFPLTDNGKINRKKLADIIYNNSQKRELLNNLTYIYVGNEIKHMVKLIKNQNVIIDAPLLFESGLDKICDFTIAVLADEKTKVERICKRDGIDESVAKERLAIQPEIEYYRNHADYLMGNNGNLNEINLEEICTKIGKN